MGTKTAKQVDFNRLADALDGYRFAYLVTVDDDYRVHTVTVEPELREGVMDVGLIGGKTRKNVESRSDVTLLWPPSEPSGYSLIVDGRAEVTESDDDTAAAPGGADPRAAAPQCRPGNSWVREGLPARLRGVLGALSEIRAASQPGNTISRPRRGPGRGDRPS